jgi:hypothetical protein
MLNVRLLLAFAGHVLFMPPGTKYFLEFEEDSVLLIHKSLTYWNAFDPASQGWHEHDVGIRIAERQKKRMILDGDPGAKKARLGSYCRGAMGPTGYQLSKWGQRKEVEKWPKPREVQRKSKPGSSSRAILDTNVMEEPPCRCARYQGS